MLLSFYTPPCKSCWCCKANFKGLSARIPSSVIWPLSYFLYSLLYNFDPNYILHFIYLPLYLVLGNVNWCKCLEGYDCVLITFEYLHHSVLVTIVELVVFIEKKNFIVFPKAPMASTCIGTSWLIQHVPLCVLFPSTYHIAMIVFLYTAASKMKCFENRVCPLVIHSFTCHRLLSASYLVLGLMPHIETP